MKILMIAPTPFFSDRGCHVRIFEEIKGLKSLGHDVTIYTYHLGKDPEGVNIKRIKNVPSYTKTSAGPSYKKIYLDLLLLSKLLKDVKKEDYDIIHAHLHEGAGIGMILKYFKKIPMIFDYQGSLVKEMRDHKYLNNKPLKSIFKKIEKKINNSSKYLLTSSTKSKESLEEEGYKNVISFLDWVDTEKFNKKDATKLKEELNLKDKQVITFLGVLSKYQGTDLLLNTIPLVIKEIPDAHFLIAGYPNVELYKEKAKELGISEHVTFTGQIDYNLAPEYISTGDITISLKLSKTEANGKLYNYMACGIPTIATNNEINKEILQETGIYVEPNIKDCSEKIISLLKNENLRRKLGNDAREKVVNIHSWKNRGQILTEVYEKCLKSH
jgi:glycosyltransferase involved in cell wall biosynthesis